jgi:hypothetical protein
MSRILGISLEGFGFSVEMRRDRVRMHTDI